MPYMRLTYNSKNIGRTEVSIFFPMKRPSAHRPYIPIGREKFIAKDVPLGENQKFQCVWLFHGGQGDAFDWPIQTRIIDICIKKKIMVVMPTIPDMTASVPEIGDTFRYLTEELPPYLQSILPISKAREDNFIFGFSFGGYYAYRVGMSDVDRYSVVGSSSAPLNVMEDCVNMHLGCEGYPEPKHFFNNERDIYYLAQKNVDEKKDLPKLFQACGTEDFNWNINQCARETFRAMGYDDTFVKGPGEHSYEFADWAFRQFVNWLPLAGGPITEKGAE